MAPFLDFCILRIAEHTFGSRDELARIDGIAQFLLIKRYAYDIDSFEPFLDFSFFSLAFVDEQWRLHYLLLQFYGQSWKILHIVIGILYGKLSGNEPAERGDALLSVEYFILSIACTVEID